MSNIDKHIPPEWDMVWYSLSHTPRNKMLMNLHLAHPLETRVLKHDYFDVKTYNTLLLTKEFWEEQKHETILIFQMDSAFTGFGPHVIQEFTDYDYVGSPWIKALENRVGNGGFSLRKKSAMLKCLHEVPVRTNEPEDVYFARAGQGRIDIAPFHIACRFSIEIRNPYPYPMAFHKPWAEQDNLNEPYLHLAKKLNS